MPEPAADAPASISATVAYGRPGRQWLLPVVLAPGASIGDAIARSGLLELVPELKRRSLDVGVYGRPAAIDAPVHDGDRVEVYRPLTIDPKEARRLRAQAARGRISKPR
jgi:hypothetical protein